VPPTNTPPAERPRRAAAAKASEETSRQFKNPWAERKALSELPTNVPRQARKLCPCDGPMACRLTLTLLDSPSPPRSTLNVAPPLFSKVQRARYNAAVAKNKDLMAVSIEEYFAVTDPAVPAPRPTVARSNLKARKSVRDEDDEPLFPVTEPAKPLRRSSRRRSAPAPKKEVDSEDGDFEDDDFQPDRSDEEPPAYRTPATTTRKRPLSLTAEESAPRPPPTMRRTAKATASILVDADNSERVPGKYESKYGPMLTKAIIINKVSPPAGIAHEDPFSFLETHPRLQKELRQYEAAVEPYNPKGERHDPTHWALSAKSGSDCGSIVNLDRYSFTYDEAMSICSLLVRAVNRWPDPKKFFITSARATALTSILLRAAIARATPDLPLPWSPPTLKLFKTQWRVGLKLPYIDSVTLDATWHEVVWTFGTSDSREPIGPEENIVFVSNWYPSRPINNLLGVRPGIDIKGKLDANNQSEFLLLDTSLRSLASKYARHASPVRTKAEMNAWVSKLAAQRHVYRGIHPMIVTDGNHYAMKTKMNPSKAMRQDIDDIDFTVRVDTINMGWAASIKDKVSDTWHESGDILDALHMLLRKADETNQRIRHGEPAPNTCYCTPEQRVSSTHACGHCGATRLCSSLTDHPAGYRACKSCMSKGFSTAKHLLAHLRKRLVKIIYCELKKMKRPTTQAAQLSESLIESGIPGLPTSNSTDFQDAYTRQQLQPRARSGIIKSPFQPSIDAAFPFGLDSQGSAAIHTHGNLIVTQMALNFCKHIQLPVFLVTLRDYYTKYADLEGDLANGVQAAWDRMKLLRSTMVQDCRRLRAVRLRTPFTTKDRGNLQPSRGLFEYMKEEWVSGKLHVGTTITLAERRGLGVVRPEWDLSILAMTNIAKEIQDWTGVNLPTGSDGCPFFCHVDAMPSDWS
jgi:hypothetical protein